MVSPETTGTDQPPGEPATMNSLERPAPPSYMDEGKPRFAAVLAENGSQHIISVNHVIARDSSWNFETFSGRAFCGTKTDSDWTNWADNASVEHLCKRCLKSWVAACARESDPDALAELRGLLGGE